jgi:hypothetical protein
VKVVLQVPVELAPVENSARCHVAPCKAVATHTPILRIALRGSEHVSFVTLPMSVCDDHRDCFAEQFLTPERRAKMETTLQTSRRGSPDWDRTWVEFEGV